MHESQESTGLSSEFLSETPLANPTDHLSYWHDHLKSWETSGLSQAEYCRRHDLKYREKNWPKNWPGTNNSPLPGDE
jgi:hypothetical protein